VQRVVVLAYLASALVGREVGDLGSPNEAEGLYSMEIITTNPDCVTLKIGRDLPDSVTARRRSAEETRAFFLFSVRGIMQALRGTRELRYQRSPEDRGKRYAVGR
jgi:hypothetical protein